MKHEDPRQFIPKHRCPVCGGEEFTERVNTKDVAFEPIVLGLASGRLVFNKMIIVKYCLGCGFILTFLMRKNDGTKSKDAPNEKRV